MVRRATLFALWALLAGCSATQYPNEGPGETGEKFLTNVPPGALGVCRVEGSERPPLVRQEVWEHARACTSRTPRRFLRLGLVTGAVAPGADAILEALATAAMPEGDGSGLLLLTREVRRQALQSRGLKTRALRGADTQARACDVGFLLRTMDETRKRIEKEPCPIVVYDQTDRRNTCLVDVTSTKTIATTSSWDCFTHDTGVTGTEKSCYRLCGFDDHCAAQISCSAPDLDLLFCAAGVCLPEARVAF